MVLHKGCHGFSFCASFWCVRGICCFSCCLVLCWWVTLSVFQLMYKKNRFPECCSFDFLYLTMFVCSPLFLVSPVGSHVITQEVGHGFPQQNFRLNLSWVCMRFISNTGTGAGIYPSSFGSHLLIIAQPQLHASWGVWYLMNSLTYESAMT